MQLCGCCSQGSVCKLGKFVDEDFFAPCEWFKLIEGLPQRQYEALKEQICRVRDETGVSASHQATVVDIPLEITSRKYPHPQAFLHFLNVDLSNTVERNRFISRYIAPHFQLDYASMLEPFEDKLMKAQQELQAFVFAEGKRDLKGINKHLSHVVPQVYSDGTALKSDVLFKGGIAGPLSQGDRPIALFVVQLVEALLKRQPLKRCPVCQRFFIRKARKNSSANCGKPACKTEWSRNKGAYTKGQFM